MEELIKLYEDGKTLNEISLLTSISISTIYKKLNGCGISFRNKGILPKDIRKDVYDLHLKGMNYKQISKELNVCYDTIKKNNSLVVKHINFVNNKIGNKGKIFQVSYGGSQTSNIAKWLYKNSTENTRLDRKYKIAREKYDIGESTI